VNGGARRPTSRQRPPARSSAARAGATAPGTDARRLAAEALERIADGGAYANLLVPTMLERTSLERRDRGFVTELVYGTTRRQRACDWLVDRFLPDPDRIDATARAWLRLGAFQLAFLDTPPHAAVGATVGAAPPKIKGLLNAVLRKVAGSLPVTWPSEGVRLSQPDWIVRVLTADLGAEPATAALEAMNEAPEVTTRADGYVQDLASQWVADAVGAGPGDLVLDVCAAPGGKATAMAATGARVVAADARPGRVGLITENAERLGLAHGAVRTLAADGTRPALRRGTFDKVLLDAPCSGLGALRRRPDARWRIGEEDVASLSVLQRRLVDASLDLVRPGGELVYSVCTLTRAESEAVDRHVAAAHPDVEALPVPGAPWVGLGRGALLLPQAAGTDGMYLLRLRVPG
jgi:16S rRNA (cytosine967-C5)-methyltransferase